MDQLTEEVTRLFPQVITPCEFLKFTSIGSGGEEWVCHEVFKWDLFFIFEPRAVNSPIDNTRSKIEICTAINPSLLLLTVI